MSRRWRRRWSRIAVMKDVLIELDSLCSVIAYFQCLVVCALSVWRTYSKSCVAGRDAEKLPVGVIWFLGWAVGAWCAGVGPVLCVCVASGLFRIGSIRHVVIPDSAKQLGCGTTPQLSLMIGGSVRWQLATYQWLSEPAGPDCCGLLWGHDQMWSEI